MITSVSRRQLAKGAAWSVPVAAASAVPAMAASPNDMTKLSICKLHYGSGDINTNPLHIHIQPSNGRMDKGDSITCELTVDDSTRYTDLGIYKPQNSTAPNLTYAGNSDWTLQLTPGPAVNGGTKKYTLTLTANRSFNMNNYGCFQVLQWTDGNTGNVIANGATVTFSDSSGNTLLKWQTPRRRPNTATKSYTRAMKFISKGGSQTCYPIVAYGSFTLNPSYMGSDGPKCGESSQNNTSTIYPDGYCAFAQKRGGGDVDLASRC